MEKQTERLDQYVARTIGTSRKVSVNLIKADQVRVNKTIETKPSFKISPSDRIVISRALLKEADLVIPDLPIIYENNDVVVINKPVGVLTHSKGPYNPEPTVATWLEARVPAMKGNRAGIVHRLDRATSGVMILAKNPDTLALLQKQFSQRKTKKVYEAVIEGRPPNEEAVIDMPIERNPKKPQTFRTGINGKSAVTHYAIIKSNGKFSLLELKPVTGRTHQLRVHLRQIGHPILGDDLYGGKPAARLYLHAKSLEITLPGGDRRTFSAEVPKEFEAEVS